MFLLQLLMFSVFSDDFSATISKYLKILAALKIAEFGQDLALFRPEFLGFAEIFRNFELGG